MEEQNNAVVETPIVEETNDVSQTEDVSQETNQEEVISEEANNSPEEQPKDSESRRPTRAERRIQQLAGKVKELSEPKVQGDVFGNQLPPWWQNQQQEPENGELTLDQLNQKMMTVANLAVAKDRQEQQFKQTVSTHQSELEEIAKAPEFEDKAFDENFTKLYASINYDETGAFRPKMSAKEVYKSLVGAKSMGRSEGQAEASSSMAKTIANAAVTPTANRPADPDKDQKELYQKAVKTESTDDWAKVLKGIL